ncbi:C2 domain containing protein [Histomonas meleagridis]|uniref:C2 domain containing protein n=1 Tax=Histomonas meleagridis TaxID=135588 RepID=UPI00355AB3C0|nr:C2 domain containing protein [Histomonas meleagridis]
MLLHIKVIEAEDLPKVDVGSLCDGYCKLKIGKLKYETRKIENSLKPMWRNEYHIPINNFNDDTLSITLIDYDKVGKDDVIADYTIEPKYLAPGTIYDDWYEMHPIMRLTKNPRIHLVYHLADLNDVPFVARPFQINLTHIRAIEAKLDRSVGTVTCDLTIDNFTQSTRSEKYTDSVIWEQEFTFITCTFDEKIIKVSINEKESIATTSIQLSALQPGTVTKQWFDLMSVKENKKIGQIRLAIHPCAIQDIPFAGELEDPVSPPDSLQAFFKIVEIKNLKAMDIGNSSDPYCVIYDTSDSANKKKTRIIKKTLNPRWNSVFSFNVSNVDTSTYVIEVYDYDGVGKDDLIGSIRIPGNELKSCGFVDKWVEIYKNSSTSNGSMHIMYQLVPEGLAPFTPMQLQFGNLYVHVMEALNIPKMDTFGKTDAYCKVKLNKNKNWDKTSVQDDTMYPVWNQTFIYTCHDVVTQVFQVEMLDSNVGKDRPIGSVDIPLEIFSEPGVKDLWVTLNPVKGVDYGGDLHIYFDFVLDGVTPFQGISFRSLDESQRNERIKQHKLKLERMKQEKSKHKKEHHGKSSSGHYKKHKSRKEKPKTTKELKPFDSGLTLYVNVVRAVDLPAMDSNGFSDPYCVLMMNDQKNKKEKTSTIHKELNPVWNEFFALNVLSVSTDILNIDVYDHDAVGKDDVIGHVQIPIYTIQPGIINNGEFNITKSSNPNKYRGKLYLEYHLARKTDVPFVPAQFMFQMFHVRVLTGQNCGPDAYFRLYYSNDKKYQSTKVKSDNKWNEEFHFYVTDGLEDKFIVELWTTNKKEQQLSILTLPFSDFALGKNVEKTYDLPKTKSKISLIFNREEYGKPAFPGLPLLQPDGYIGNTVTLNIRLIEGTDIPAMDLNGKSDPYVKFAMLGRKDKPVKSKIIKKTLTPVWNQDFHFEVKSIGTDTMKIGLFDYDEVGGDDKIGKYMLDISQLQPGVVLDRWFDFAPHKGVKKGGKVHMIIHLADAGQVAFYEQPFKPYVAHLCVCEAKDLPKMDIGSLSDPYCSITISNDVRPKVTFVEENTLSPQWWINYDFLITSLQNDCLNIVMRDKDKLKDEDMGYLTLPLKGFEIGYIYNQWFDMKPAKNVKNAGKIKLKIHISPSDIPAWQGTPVPPPPLPASDKLTLHVHLIQGFNIPAVDANGKADPYCTLSFIGRKEVVKSRILNKTLNPCWDDQLKLDVLSLGSDILRIELMDHDAVGKDDKISIYDIPLNTIPPGIVQYGKFDFTPVHGNKYGGQIEMKYQIVAPNQIPYTNVPFIPYQLNVRVVDIKDTKCKDKKVNSMFTIKLKNDTNAQRSSIKQNTLNPTYNQEFFFLVTDPKSDILCLDYSNDATKSLIGKCEFPLKSLQYEVTSEQNIPLSNGGSTHLYVQLGSPNQMPFLDANLPPATIDEVTLYVKVLEATGVPAMDNNGLADTYCKLRIIDRDEPVKTEIKPKTLTPSWNQEFHFPIKCLESDQFELVLYDHDKVGKDDKIGSLILNVCELEYGIVNDKFYNLKMSTSSNTSTSIHLIIHLAGAFQPKFINVPFVPTILNVEIAEAMDIPKVDTLGKTDPYCVFGFVEDLKKKRTSVKDNTLSPQWFEKQKVIVTNSEKDIFKLVLKDQGVKNTEVSSLEIPLSSLEFGHVTDKWYDLVPCKSYKNGGKIRLILHHDNPNVEPFKGIIDPKPPLPQCESLQFNVRLIGATNLPTMDVTGSDGYCSMQFIGRDDTIQKSRIIDNSLNPLWNQDFFFKVKSLNSDEFRFIIMDKDKLKDDLISYTSFALKTLEPGVVYDKYIDMIPYKEDKGGRLHVIYHLTNKGDIPFVQNPFIPFEAHFRLTEIQGLKDKTNYFCDVQLEDEIKSEPSLVSNTGLFNMESRFILTDPSNDKIQINLNEQYQEGKIITSKNISKGLLLLESIQQGQTVEQEVELKGSITCKCKVLITILPINTPFTYNQPTIIPFIGEQRYAHFYIKEARNLPRADGPRGLTDAYVKNICTYNNT